MKPVESFKAYMQAFSNAALENSKRQPDERYDAAGFAEEDRYLTFPDLQSNAENLQCGHEAAMPAGGESDCPIAKGEPDVEDLAHAISAIIQNRHDQLPIIDALITEEYRKKDAIQHVISSFEQLRSWAKDERFVDRIRADADDMRACKESLEQGLANLKKIRQEFSSDVYFEGVSGSSGVGKSATLQALTGLSDKVMPTGKDGFPITAVRAEYVNSEQCKAEVTFRTKQMFMG